jgi:hypothetical protein
LQRQQSAAALTHDKAKPRDKARDAQLAFALLLTDWLHGDRHYQGELLKLALRLLDDLGEDGAEAKERLTAMPPKPTAVPAATAHAPAPTPAPAAQPPAA